MSEQARYFRVGLFVLLGAALILGFALLFGGGGWFQRRLVVETYFTEPVTGLDVGSPVRFRGVPVGSVSGIGFVTDYYRLPDRANELASEGKVIVLMELRAREREHEDLFDEGAEGLQELIDRGLRVRITSSGLTGTSYILADFMDPEANPPAELHWKPRHLYIPSAPSTIAKLTSAAERLAERLEEANLVKVVQDIDTLILTMEKTLSDFDVPSLQKKAEGLIGDLHETSAALRTAVAATDVGELSSGAQQSIARLNEVLNRIDDIVAAGAYDVEASLSNVRIATDNLRDTTQTLREYPALLLLGDAPPEQP